MSISIQNIRALEVLDSRGNPTLEVIIETSQGKFSSMVPSGASTGMYEALELRDNDKKRFHGKGVLQAKANIENSIAPHFIGKSLEDIDQKELDNLLCELDGTENKSKFGANAILGVSMSFAKAKAFSQKKELYQYFQSIHQNAQNERYRMPMPLMNIINGGAHANSGIDIQECMIVPISATSFAESVRMGSEVFHTLKKILEKEGYSTGVGDEGGFAPHLESNEQALNLIIKAIEEARYEPRKDVALALDVAASEFYDKEKNMYAMNEKGAKKIFSALEMEEYYENLCKIYPIISIEDPFDQDDFESFKNLTQKIGNTTQIVGDDLFVTNVKRIQKGIENKAANAILIKLNQIGTVSETLNAILLGQKNGYRIIISHRSGETEDTTIADLAIGTNAGQIKTGSLSRSERVAKYNRLIQIEDQEKNNVKFSSIA